MGEPIVLEDFKERVILVGVSEQDGDDAEDSLAELAELVKTAGASVAGTLIQKRELIHPGTYVGTGKVAEIAELLEHTGATGIVCDDELSPAQLKNLETMLNTKVMDRTLIILDIFAARATTSEGKIQVELAQLKYRLSRLTGLGRSMSRLGGGIGTRGPGEKKLEIDRRLINDRIAQLNRELKEVVKHREIARAKRERNAVPVVAIVGYTNAGKSTLLNHLTDAEVLEEDKLFATLDPTTRMLELEGHQQVLLTDTVGFIRKLPHQLIECGLVLGVSRIHLDCPGVIAVRLVQPSMYIKHSAAQIVPLGIPALLRNPLQQLLRFAQAVGIEQLPNIGKLRPTLTRVALTGVARIGISTVC